MNGNDELWLYWKQTKPFISSQAFLGLDAACLGSEYQALSWILISHENSELSGETAGKESSAYLIAHTLPSKQYLHTRISLGFIPLSSRYHKWHQRWPASSWLSSCCQKMSDCMNGLVSDWIHDWWNYQNVPWAELASIHASYQIKARDNPRGSSLAFKTERSPWFLMDSNETSSLKYAP